MINFLFLGRYVYLLHTFLFDKMKIICSPFVVITS